MTHKQIEWLTSILFKLSKKRSVFLCSLYPYLKLTLHKHTKNWQEKQSLNNKIKNKMKNTLLFLMTYLFFS